LGCPDCRGSGCEDDIDLHPDEFFRETCEANGKIASIEPAVQQGADGVITIDLARPARVTAFTLPATGSYAWRLVVDVHTN